MVSGFPEKRRSKVASLALLQPLLGKLQGMGSGDGEWGRGWGLCCPGRRISHVEKMSEGFFPLKIGKFKFGFKNNILISLIIGNRLINTINFVFRINIEFKIQIKKPFLGF